MESLLILNVEGKIKLSRTYDLVLYLNNNLLNFGIKHILLDDLLNKNTNSIIYKKIIRFSKTWYKPFEKNLFYEELSLPNLVEMSVLSFWPAFLKIEILSKFIKRHKPKEIHLITNNEEDIRIIKELTKDKKINFSFKLVKTKIKRKFEFKKSFYPLIAKLQNLLLKIYLIKNHKKNILFLGNVRQTLPLLKELKKNKQYAVIRAGENLGKGVFVEHSDYYFTFKKNKTPKKIRSLMQKKFNEFVNHKDFVNNPQLLILKDQFKRMFLEDFSNLIYYIKKFKKINSKIDMIVAHNDILSFEKSLILTANKLKIPTLTMIEGFLPDKQMGKDGLFIPFNAEKIALFSKSQKDFILKNYKISEDRLNVIGYPLFDQYYNEKPIKKEEIYKRYNVPLDKKIVLYTAERYSKDKFKGSIFGAFTQKQCELVYEELFNSFKDFKDLFLIVKKHPSGSADDELINNIAKKTNFRNYVISNDLDIHNLLNASYLIITRLSNMGLEAMLLGKYVIIMDTYLNSNDNFGYTRFNASLHAKKKWDLKNLLNKLTKNKNLQIDLKRNIKKFVIYNYSVNDGKSSERMANLIKEMTNNKSYKQKT